MTDQQQHPQLRTDPVREDEATSASASMSGGSSQSREQDEDEVEDPTTHHKLVRLRDSRLKTPLQSINLAHLVVVSHGLKTR